MAKEAAARYGSASEFADDLRRFLGGCPILAQRPGAPKRAARWARRNKAAVSIAMVVLALFLVGISGCGSGSSDPSKLPPDDPAIRQRTEQIDRFKARTTRPVSKPRR